MLEIEPVLTTCKSRTLPTLVALTVYILNDMCNKVFSPLLLLLRSKCTLEYLCTLSKSTKRVISFENIFLQLMVYPFSTDFLEIEVLYFNIRYINIFFLRFGTLLKTFLYKVDLGFIIHYFLRDLQFDVLIQF